MPLGSGTRKIPFQLCHVTDRGNAMSLEIKGGPLKQALDEAKRLRVGECEWCGVPVLAEQPLCLSCHRAKYGENHQRAALLPWIAGRTVAGVAVIRRNVVPTLGAL